jgi:hypothetical protein
VGFGTWLLGGPERPFWKRHDFRFYTIGWAAGMAATRALGDTPEGAALSTIGVEFAKEFIGILPFGIVFGWLMSRGFRFRTPKSE